MAAAPTRRQQMQPRHAIVPIILSALLITVSGARSEDRGCVDVKGSHLDMLHDGKPLVRYMYAHDTSTPECQHETYKVYCHVLDAAGTGVLTKGPGGKFTHHRGIFLGWSRLGFEGKRYDLWHMKNKATQRHKAFVSRETQGERTIVSARIDWVTDGEAVAIEETRTFTLHHNDKDAHLLLDVQCELRAPNGDVDLNGDPEHAGFQYRPHNDVAGNKSPKYTFHKEGIKPQKDRDLPWVAETYRLRDADYTVQHMSHPDNPGDAVYSAYRDYGRFGEFFKAAIANGETLTLNYRIRITQGEAPPRELLATQYETYLEQ
jgi:hypothetical protein